MGIRFVGFVLVPLALLVAWVGPRSVQGPVQGRVTPSDEIARDDVVARLRCHAYGIHGAHRASQQLRVFASDARFWFPWAWRGLAPAGCKVELLHPLYHMQHLSLERRFSVDLGAVSLRRWDDLLAAPGDLTIAEIHRHLFHVRHDYFGAFVSETERARLAQYAPALRSLYDRGLRVLPPMGGDRFGSARSALSLLRQIEEATDYARPPAQEALFEASAAGEAERIPELIGDGADPDGWNASHQAPLHLAARGRHREALVALLDSGAQIDLREQGTGPSALLIALQRRDADTARVLLERGADVTLAARGATPLKAAAGNGMIELVHLLLARGAIAHAREPRHPVDALHAAARVGRSDVVRVLLDAGVPVDGGLPGFTALMHAAWMGHPTTVELLLARGADPAAVSITGETPLAYARRERREAVVALLEGIDAAE